MHKNDLKTPSTNELFPREAPWTAIEIYEKSATIRYRKMRRKHQ